ncbi:ABC-type bacteriocin/lantibiotic exporter, contains an N-terminal double-glycine peptidase domain [Salinimicrobium catena]|uniref:ABC-type bacteriocin/lantibiotic exporter, contains an N-terminal double-glycine peptidase domain n=1 Tax=Salinimicrobium catena TaxID=390640 RepID=A0A1H5NUS4_9FLAO|nr:ATP-binding cassette domain-containing protein [Salinimicrobium catena]SDL61119.1 ABC-type bacteriocin/lantibiotic exporter, contains an N-terminal double-glycine peptidase domain [Salinimicrobium catena]SEF05326.1 ABC-type bacteriocin/lantibiotic exporter, contains an N-terminal double-glycine peptidase domain [Salinimicrobium catena]
MAKESISPLKRLYRLLSLDRKDILQTFYYAIFAGLLNLSVPLGIQAIINFIQGGRVSTSWIILVVLVTIAVGFVGILELMQLRIVENLQQKIFTRASFDFAFRFPKIKMNEFKNSYPPEQANRFFDILSVQKGVAKLLLDFPAALIQILFGLILLSLYHPVFIIFGLLLVGLIYLVFRFTAKKGMETSLDESKSKYKVAHWLQEVARSLLSFKLSGDTSISLDKNDKYTTKYLTAREEHFGILKIQYIKMIIFKVLVTGGLLAVGGMLVLNQEMNIGQFVAAEIIILLIMGSVEKLTKGLNSVYDTLTSLEKLGQVLDLRIEKQESENKLPEGEPLQIELSDVGFLSEDTGKTVLKDINLKILPGERIILDGSNGSGRSSLLKLISGVTEASSGNIYINDLSIKNIKINEFRSRVGVFFPEEVPFEGSLLENLTFGDARITEKEVLEVLKVLGLSQFLRQQSNGLKSMIYPEGKFISNLERKKIILARAILKKPDLLVLKEPLELFNKEEAERIVDYVSEEKHSWSILVASQNKIWEKVCTKRIVLENGRIKETIGLEHA